MENEGSLLVLKYHHHITDHPDNGHLLVIKGDLLLWRSCSPAWGALWGERGTGWQVCPALSSSSSPASSCWSSSLSSSSSSSIWASCSPPSSLHHPHLDISHPHSHHLEHRHHRLLMRRATQRDLLAAQLGIWVFGLLALWVLILYQSLHIAMFYILSELKTQCRSLSILVLIHETAKVQVDNLFIKQYCSTIQYSAF